MICTVNPHDRGTGIQAPVQGFLLLGPASESSSLSASRARLPAQQNISRVMPW